jgi:hypothetical protein
MGQIVAKFICTHHLKGNLKQKGHILDYFQLLIVFGGNITKSCRTITIPEIIELLSVNVDFFFNIDCPHNYSKF